MSCIVLSILFYNVVPAHFLLRQDFVALLLPTHFFPPFLAFMAVVLFLTWAPLPHVLEHADHLPQEDHLQSTMKIDEKY